MRAAQRAVQDSQSSRTAKLTVAHRLLRNDGFDHVVHAENIADSNFKIFFVGNRKKNARLGIVVRKKTLAGAAYRNRIKRIIREVFRQHRVKLCNLDMVVMVRRPCTQESGALISDLKKLFGQIENKCAEQ